VCTDDGHVQELYMPENSLHGTIPPELKAAT